MVAFNHENRSPFDGYNSAPPVNRLVKHVQKYFDQHPEVSREQFLLDAVRREMIFRDQTEMWHGEETVGQALGGSNRASAVRPPSDDEIRFGALLAERLAVLHYERYGLWPRLRRFVFGNREVRLPELPPRQTGKG